MTDRIDVLELVDRIETNPLGWLPVVGDCINITFTPDEAKVLTAALRSADLPVRCDRCGSSGDTFVLCAGCHSVTEPGENPQTEEAMFMLQDVPGATLVERVARLSKRHMELQTAGSAVWEFPYQQTFDAIAMAVSLWPSKDAATGISISVRKFQEAFNNHRDADTRSYADRAQSATAFDPELQADGDAEKSGCNHWPGQRLCGVCGMGTEGF